MTFASRNLRAKPPAPSGPVVVVPFSDVSLLINFDTVVPVDVSSYAHTLSPHIGPPLTPTVLAPGLFGGRIGDPTNGTMEIATITAPLELGTGDFTIEMWLSISSGSLNSFLIGQSVYPFDNVWAFSLSGDEPLALVMGEGYDSGPFVSSAQCATGLDVISDEFAFYVVTRQSGTLRIYVNGILRGTGTSIQSYTGANPISFWRGNGVYWTSFSGPVGPLRVTKGQVLYTGSSFTPPPITSIFPTS